jgi:hypothetical protein
LSRAPEYGGVKARAARQRTTFSGGSFVFFKAQLSLSFARAKKARHRTTIIHKQIPPSSFKPNDDGKTMATLQLIKEAIGALKERTGSSVVAINKYLETEKKVRSKTKCFRLFGAAGSRGTAAPATVRLLTARRAFCSGTPH